MQRSKRCVYNLDLKRITLFLTLKTPEIVIYLITWALQQCRAVSFRICFYFLKTFDIVLYLVVEVCFLQVEIPDEVASYLSLKPGQYSFEAFTPTTELLTKFMRDQGLIEAAKDEDDQPAPETSSQPAYEEDDDTNSCSNPGNDQWEESNTGEERAFKCLSSEDYSQEGASDEQQSADVSTESSVPEKEVGVGEVKDESAGDEEHVDEEHMKGEHMKEEHMKGEHVEEEHMDEECMEEDKSREEPVQEAEEEKPGAAEGEEEVDSSRQEDAPAESTCKQEEQPAETPAADQAEDRGEGQATTDEAPEGGGTGEGNRGTGEVNQGIVPQTENSRNIGLSSAAGTNKPPTMTSLLLQPVTANQGVRMRLVPQRPNVRVIPAAARQVAPGQTLLRSLVPNNSQLLRAMRQAPPIIRPRARIPRQVVPPVQPPQNKGKTTTILLSKNANGLAFQTLGEPSLSEEAIKNILTKYANTITIPVGGQQVLTLSQK